MCKTKPIWNQRKVHCRLGLNCPCPSLRVENEAKGRELTLHAPRSTLHAPRLTPTVASGSGGSGEWREASGDIEDGEPERSEPTQEETPASEKAQNEANSESTQGSLPLEVESSATESAGRKRSQSATGGVLPHAEDGGERIVAGGQ